LKQAHTEPLVWERLKRSQGLRERRVERWVIIAATLIPRIKWTLTGCAGFVDYRFPKNESRQRLDFIRKIMDRWSIHREVLERVLDVSNTQDS
jgi:hypothetical protein